MTPTQTEIHITELAGYKLPKEVQDLLRDDLLNGKGYDACHRAIQAQTGIWIPELEQPFKDLDALLGLPPYDK
ncbi:hypothetical protein [Devosia sp. XK-2]|uniref:hypothetical protein n=1 Tax=Devosia sp. XK-2 TaxID=3126689 RepID=UPI0030D3B121